MDGQAEKVVLITLTQEQLQELNAEAAKIGAAEAFKHIMQEKNNRVHIMELRKVKMTRELISSYKTMKEMSGLEHSLTAGRSGRNR